MLKPIATKNETTKEDVEATEFEVERTKEKNSSESDGQVMEKRMTRGNR
jgi:hypothetical protein